MKIFPFFIPHEGCPHHCLFCQQQHIAGISEAPSPAEIFSILERDLPAWGEGEVAFFGGSFTLLPAELQRAYLDQVESFIRSGHVSGIRVSTRPDALDDDKVVLLKNRGVTTVELGCQSFSAKVLARSRRGHGPDAAAGAVPLLRRQGLRIGLQLMPGLPEGDRDEAVFSLRRALALKPDFVRLYPTVVLKGTALESAWREGYYRPPSLEEAVDWCADLLLLCRQAQVPVIRLGLQSTLELDKGDAVLAGPYHPAFGQLVRSRLWRRAFERELAKVEDTAVTVHPADLSDALGHRCDNFRYLQQRFPGFSLSGHKGLLRDQFKCGDRSFFLNTTKIKDEQIMGCCSERVLPA